MKFFTMQWWTGCQDLSFAPARNAADQYQDHLTRIRDRLSQEALRIVEELPLHDSRLRLLEIDMCKAVLLMELDAVDSSGQPIKVTLTYEELTSVRSIVREEESLSGPNGYGDLGYDEIDLADDRFEHRILFSTGIELDIVFGKVSTAIHPRDASNGV